MYNEQSTIGDIIERTKKAVQRIGDLTEILVVDDKSFDRSLEIAKRNGVRLLALKEHLGKG